jgi:hypothetical protein
MKAAEAARIQASQRAAESERVYRIALSRKIVELHADGVAWTVAQDVARGDEKVAQLRYERDIARGVLDVSEQVTWRHTADRRDLTELVKWSGRVPDGYEPGRFEDVSARRVA